MRELTPSNDAIEELLAQWSAHARRSLSLEKLLSQWSRLVQGVETGYEITLDDYMNDVDTRVMLDEVLVVADPQLAGQLRERLQPLDKGSWQQPTLRFCWMAQIGGEVEYRAR